MVPREGQIRIKKQNKTQKQNKVKRKKKKTEPSINPGRKCITSFSLLGFSLFLLSKESANVSFLSHLIPKRALLVSRKSAKLNRLENLFTPSKNTTQETTFILAPTSFLLFPVGIGLKTPKPKAYMLGPGTARNGVWAATSHSSSWPGVRSPMRRCGRSTWSSEMRGGWSVGALLSEGKTGSIADLTLLDLAGG